MKYFLGMNRMVKVEEVALNHLLALHRHLTQNDSTALIDSVREVARVGNHVAREDSMETDWVHVPLDCIWSAVLTHRSRALGKSTATLAHRLLSSLLGQVGHLAIRLALWSHS